jgi:tetratricopeptide (TPR) repeat protein
LIGKAREFSKKGDYASAERAWRVELTRYIGWVFHHTLILIKHPAGPPLELMQIDVGALEELAESIAWVLDRQGKPEGILHSFEHLAATLPLPGLRERMAYLKCLWLLQRFNDDSGANAILSEWSSHERIRDVRLLQIYFQMRASSLSLIKRMDVAQKIIEQTTSSVEKLHYSTAKAMVMVLVGDNDEAKKLHTEALNAFLPIAADAAKEGDLYPSSICARALEMQGTLTKDKIAFERALGFLERINVAELTAEGGGELLYAQGRLNWLKGDWSRAVECFTDSYKKHPGVLPLIYRLDGYVRMNALEEAKHDLVALRNASIPEEYRLEFLRGAAGLAVKTGDADEARNLVKDLKSLDLDILNFRVQRDELCVELLEFAAEQMLKKTTAVKRQTFLERIRKGSEYLHLKPNIFGLGLNLNRLFEQKEGDSK